MLLLSKEDFAEEFLQVWHDHEMKIFLPWESTWYLFLLLLKMSWDHFLKYIKWEKNVLVDSIQFLRWNNSHVHCSLDLFILFFLYFLHPQSFGSDLHVISEEVSDRAWEKGNVILYFLVDDQTERNSQELGHFSQKIGDFLLFVTKQFNFTLMALTMTFQIIFSLPLHLMYENCISHHHKKVEKRESVEVQRVKEASQVQLFKMNFLH